MPRRTLDLQVKCAGPDVVVTVASTGLTEENAGRLDEQVAALVGPLVPARLRLDLGQVELLSSIPLRQLLALNKRVREAGGQLVVENVSPIIRALLSLTRADQILDVRPLAT